MRVKFTQDYAENRGQKLGDGEPPRTYKKDEVVDFTAEYANAEPEATVTDVAAWRRQRAAASARHFINRGVAVSDDEQQRDAGTRAARRGGQAAETSTPRNPLAPHAPNAPH